MPTKKINDWQLDIFLANVKFKNPEQQKSFDEVSKNTWFRQYAKKSKTARNKITAKVKQGIKHGKYTYNSGSPEVRGFIMPKPKKAEKQKKITKEVKPKNKIVKKKGSITRKEREQIKQTIYRSPSGRIYSKSEIREGLGSKRAIAYRRAHGIPENDYSVRGKK